MKIKSAHIVTVVMGLMVLIMMGCSAQKNTWKSRFWQSFTGKYNSYYNGTLAYIDGSLEKEKSNVDNFTEMIPLYTVGNKKSATLGSSNFDKAIEKCEKTIKLHSIKKKPEWNKKGRKTEKDIAWLSRKEYNPMLWKAWMLMGRSQFYKADFDASSVTFSYISRIYQGQPAIYSKARAWLAKSYIEEDWMYEAEDVIRNMQRDSIHWSAQKEWDYTYADYYIHTGEYEKAIPYLKKVIKHEMRKKQKARECFLLGQLYAELGMRKEAYKAYKKVIRQNPPYLLEFNARIAMTEVMAEGHSKQMISRLKRMARNDNNKEYLDQVYYALGNIYMTQKDTVKAISAYEKGNKKATRNGIEKGVLLLRLGDIYWDMEKYADAGRCYGEAIGLLDKERKDYEQLADRSKKLDQLVPFTEAIHLQDSLQELALMSEKDRNEAIDRVIEALKKKEKEEKDKAAEEAAQQAQNANGGNPNQRPGQPQQRSPQDDGTFYFYSQLSVAQGKTAFQKQWGKRENEDHWNRKNKTVVASFSEDLDENLTEEQRDSIAAAEKLAEEAEEGADSAVNDPHKREYYLAQIPFTEEQVLESNLIIMDGLYNSGVIFKDKLDKLNLSKKQFDRLETQYPTYEQMQDAYYHEFLLYSRMGDAERAQSYVDKLRELYPEHQWTLLLTDPYFAENQKFGMHIEDSLYAATYQAFKGDRYDEVAANAKISAERFPLGANRDKFIFISGLSKLNAGDSDGCLEDMKKVVSDYGQSKLATMAGMIVNGVNQGKSLRGGKFDIDNVWARRSVVMSDSDSIAARKFTDDRNIDFVFMIAYEPDSLNENQLLFQLAKYNFTSYMVRNFDLEIEDQDGLHVMKVSGFNNYEEALEYAHQFYRQPSLVAALGKSRTLVISQTNKELLGVNFSYDDYDAFYDEHFAPLKTEEMDRLYEPSGRSDELDDGGSIPGNISPILLKQKEEKSAEEESEPGEGDKDAIMIEDFAAPSATTDDNIIIEEETIAPVNPTADNDIVVEEEPSPVPDKKEENIVVEEEPVVPAVSPAGNDDIIIEDETTVPAVSPAGNDDIIIEDEPTVPAVSPAGNDDIIIEDETNVPAVSPAGNDDIIIEDETTVPAVSPAGNDEIIILDDDAPATPVTTDDNTIVLDEGSTEEGSEDEYYELDGF